MTCDPNARPHEHLDGGLIRVWARDKSWGPMVMTDDGSVCPAVVTPTPAKYPPEAVLASMLVERNHIEADIRRNANKRERSRRSRKGI